MSDRSDPSDAPNPGVRRELAYFLRHHKLWWMTPILLVFGLVLLLVMAGSSQESGFTYDLF